MILFEANCQHSTGLPAGSCNSLLNDLTKDGEEQEETEHLILETLRAEGRIEETDGGEQSSFSEVRKKQCEADGPT